MITFTYKTWNRNKRNATKTKQKTSQRDVSSEKSSMTSLPKRSCPFCLLGSESVSGIQSTHRAVQHVFSVLCLPLQCKLLNHGLSTIHTPPLLTPARGPFAWQSGHRVHYPSFTFNNCPASQGKSNRRLGWHCKSGGCTDPFRNGV